MKRAFTIVELVIVIAVIGILAGLVTVAYMGITQSAKEVAVKSDIDGVVGLLERHKQRSATNTYPAAISAVDFTFSAGNNPTYTTTGGTFCLEVTNPDVTPVFSYRSTERKVAEETCEPMVTTFAGDTRGSTDGPLATARLDAPNGIVAVGDAIYFSDMYLGKIRKIEGGEIKPFAGLSSGYAEGTGTAARFTYPRGIAADGAGNIYVADATNNRIRKITPGGTSSLLAGSGVTGFANGTGAAAQFSNPHSVAVDTGGVVYVGDSGNHRIRKITPSGVVTTLAGSGVAGFADGTGAAAQFNGPSGVSVGPSGNLYVADRNRIRKITPTGVVTTLAGSGANSVTNGQGVAASFSNTLISLYVDASETVYAVEYGGAIRKILPDGTVTTYAGANGSSSSVDGPAASARFTTPYDITGTPDGALYVTELWGFKIRKIH